MILILVVIVVCLLIYSNKDKTKEILNLNKAVYASSESRVPGQEEPESEIVEIATSQFLEEQEEITDNESAEDTTITEEPDIKALYPVEISDIHAEAEERVEFISFYPGAAGYTWEVYDMDQKSWIPAEPTAVSTSIDELYREVSVFQILAEKEQDVVMVRCVTKLEDGSSQTDTASLYILPKKITDIKISDTEVPKCGYFSSLEVPVTVIYEDGTSEDMTGLYGLKFLCSKRNIEYDESETGNLIEKRIDIITECDYSFLESGANEKILRYKNLREEEHTLQITACDKEPPVISDVVIGEYKISQIDKPVQIQVEVYAEDNDTPYPYLEYAFAYETVTEENINFIKENEFSVDVDKNGTWIIYVRDQGGNVAQLERKIIAVDQLAPGLTVNLKETTWCQENVISVVGKDGTNLVYQIFKGSECIYDWTENTSFPISENGNYTVKARDEAGNETIQEILVQNIDIQAPVINNIKEGGSNSNEY